MTDTNHPVSDDRLDDMWEEYRDPLNDPYDRDEIRERIEAAVSEAARRPLVEAMEKAQHGLHGWLYDQNWPDHLGDDAYVATVQEELFAAIEPYRALIATTEEGAKNG